MYLRAREVLTERMVLRSLLYARVCGTDLAYGPAEGAQHNYAVIVADAGQYNSTLADMAYAHSQEDTPCMHTYRHVCVFCILATYRHTCIFSILARTSQ